VTTPKTTGWTVDGEPVGQWLHRNRRDVVQAALADLREGTVGDDAERAAQLRWIIDYTLGLYIRHLQDPDAPIDEATASDLVASAATRASEGYPIESLLDTYLGGSAAIWRRLADHARPDELPALTELTTELFEFLRRIMALVVRGFQREAAQLTMDERDARFAVYSALLTGADPARASARWGVALGSRYLVLALRIEEPGLGARDAPAHVNAAWRSNTVLRALDGIGEGEVLALIRGTSGTALIPLDPDAVDDQIEAKAAVARIAADLGVPVHAGAAIADVDDLAAAATQAEEILALVTAIGHPSGAWFLDDVLLQYQLTRPSAARDLLSKRMHALEGHPDWLHTLRTYMRTGWDRIRTAHDLHIHPNTVDYRLRRVAEVSGLDAGDLGQRPAILAALYALDVLTTERKPVL
jgi:hypothetical protein